MTHYFLLAHESERFIKAKPFFLHAEHFFALALRMGCFVSKVSILFYLNSRAEISLSQHVEMDACVSIAACRSVESSRGRTRTGQSSSQNMFSTVL